jgi:Holliday junction DNA helicase RuvA
MRIVSFSQPSKKGFQLITFIIGKLISKKPPSLTLDVNGIGYALFAPIETFQYLPELNQTVKLFTHLSIREDAHTLYGFHDETTQSLFKRLIKINGVGPKIALAILSGTSPQQLIQCIAEQNHKQLTKIPGVGPKMAERLVLELKDKLNDLGGNNPCNELAFVSNHSAAQEAFDALIALGYKEAEAKRMLKNSNESDSAEQMIRVALRG